MSSLPPAFKSTAVVRQILDFVKGGGLQPASKPGFAHALGLSYNTINKERLQWVGDDTLVYRYTFTDDTTSSSKTANTASNNSSTTTAAATTVSGGSTAPAPAPATTGLLMAIMDELQTNACFGVGQPSPPGLSLQMQCELVPTASSSTTFALSNVKELDVTSTVTKLGRTVSYVKSDFIDPSTQRLVAFGSHVKYMPTGNFVLDLVFTKPWAFKVYKYFIASKVPKAFDDVIDLHKQVIAPYLEYQGPGKATFTIGGEHVNPFGGLHGGCHAMLMELVGRHLLTHHGDTADGDDGNVDGGHLMLESMQIDYVSSGRGTVRIVAQARTLETPFVQRVAIYSSNAKDGGRLVSEGRLRWTNNNVAATTT